MKAFEIQKFAPDGLALVDRPDPTPGPGEVLVRMRAASLNFRDHLTLIGQYNPRQKLPLIPLCDGAGEVIGVGPGPNEWKVGDRVVSVFAQDWRAGVPTFDELRTSLGGPLDGTLCELRVFPAHGLVRLPDYMSYEEGATLPCAGVTAWSALVQGALRPGQVVLALGTGGVSMFALQFARAMGARVIITSGSETKLKRALELGADAGINYKEKPNWSREVRRLTDMAGADHIIEVGGVGTMDQSLKSARLFGHISLIGVLAGATTELNLTPALMQNVRIQGVVVGSRQDSQQMLEAMEFHKIRPVIGETFEFSRAPDAFRLMAAGGHFGKIVVRIP